MFADGTFADGTSAVRFLWSGFYGPNLCAFRALRYNEGNIPTQANRKAMDEHIIQQLNALNRAFYDAFAASFAASRGASEPGLERLLAGLPTGTRVLDLGCGQGRVVNLLPPGCTYTGVDFSAGMLAEARKRAPQARWVQADLLAPGWEEQVGSPWDFILLRAVLHHIPAYTARLRLIQRAARLLAAGGSLALANWQFLRLPRLRQRIRPWTEIGLEPAQLEEHDYLLDWRREGEGLRYVHWIDEDETRRLLNDAGLVLCELFYADGHDQALTLYARAQAAL